MELWDSISTYTKILTGLILALVLIISFMGLGYVRGEQKREARKEFCINKGFEGAMKIRGPSLLIDFCYNEKGQLFLKDKIR